MVNRDHPLRAQHEATANSELRDWSASPNRHSVSLLDVAIFRCHIPGRENIREENDLLIRQSLRNLQWTNIRARHARVLRLASRIAAEHVCIAE